MISYSMRANQTSLFSMWIYLNRFKNHTIASLCCFQTWQKWAFLCCWQKWGKQPPLAVPVAELIMLLFIKSGEGGGEENRNKTKDKDCLTRIAVCQEGANRQQNLWNSQSRTPVVFQDIQTDDSLTVDVAVIDSSTESNLQVEEHQKGEGKKIITCFSGIVCC